MAQLCQEPKIPNQYSHKNFRHQNKLCGDFLQNLQHFSTQSVQRNINEADLCIICQHLAKAQIETRKKTVRCMQNVELLILSHL